ncbi:MAG: DUF3300 domain-containing protein [Pseudomonadota bacterium]|jgi:hypothetical protein
MTLLLSDALLKISDLAGGVKRDRSGSAPRVSRSLVILLSAIALIVAAPQGAFAQAAGGSVSQAPSDLTPKQLEELVKPIALYPDLLLQHVLAASTFPEQILDAAVYNEQGKEPEGIKDQPWDDSVKGVANYPSILVKMASDIDWTIKLGYAFINQNEQLRAAIQKMRSKAKNVGNLEDSEQQHVIEEKGANNTTIIRIEPADPQIIYVPTTTTTVVYEKPVEKTSSWLAPLASFGVGMALGYAMGDSHNDHYYYGGGFYGPGFWYGGPAVNNWVDYRRDRWDDAYDFARDRQDWQQNNRDDWREYRQDLGRKQQDWRQERQARGTTISPEKRAEARSRVDQARASDMAQKARDRGFDRQAANQRISDAKANGFDRQAASQRLNDARASGFDRQAASQRLNDARASGNLSERAKSVDRGAMNQRMQQAKSNPEFSNRVNQARDNPALREKAHSSASKVSERRGSGGFSSGGGLSGMNRGSASVNRASARGMSSRASSGGFSRGGGGGMRRR